MIPLSALLFARALEDASMPLKPRIKVQARGIPLAGNFTEKDGKIVKKDTAPPHVRQARRRKANKVTNVKPAK
jgi:hypothetical protein